MTLLAHLDRLIASATAPSTSHADLRAAVARAVRQTASAYQASQDRSERFEAAIWAEGAQLPPSMPMKRRAWIVRNGITCRLEQHGLPSAPSDRRTREGLRRMDARIVAPSTEATR